MSESRTRLEQILELLLTENKQKADELFHDYVVQRARSEYEKVLESDLEFDDSSDGSDIDQSHSMSDDISSDEDEIDTDEIGGDEYSDDQDEDFGGEDDFGADDQDADLDLEDKVDDLQSELEDLRAEFDRLMGEEGEGELDDAEDLDAGDEDFDSEDFSDEDSDDDFGDDDEDFSDEDSDDDFGDDDEDFDDEDFDDEDDLKEATNFSQKVSTPKAGATEKTDSPLTKTPRPGVKFSSTVSPVRIKDGSDGKDSYGGGVKKNAASDNLNVKPSKVSVKKKD